jgi:hypothetical protein
MAQATNADGDGRRKIGEHAATRWQRRRGVGLDGLLAGASPPPPPRVEADPAWARATQRTARVAVWALPAYAIAYLWLSLTPAVDPVADPAGWVARVTEEGYLRLELLTGPGIVLLGLVALVALATLLAGARGRGFAVVGLLVGLGAVALWLPRDGLAMFAAPTLAEQARGGQAAAADTYARMYERASELAVIGTGLFTVALVLFGVALWRSRVFSRGDGVLLILAAPLVGTAGLYLDLLVPLGALLLLAAGVGIGWQGGRAAQSAVWQSTSPTPTTTASPTTAR